MDNLKTVVAVATLAGVAAACGDAGNSEPPVDEATPDSVAVIVETYLTPYHEIEDIDSPAVWHGPSGQHWLFATAKQGDRIWVYDAVDGTVVDTVGNEGAGPGRFDRPNGIAVAGDLLLVVERDNARLQVLSLPDFNSLGMFASDLIRPYGIAAFESGDGQVEVYITDNYETEDEQIPPDSELDHRVHHYRLMLGDGTIDAELVAVFGDTTGPGVLRKVESIAADPDRGILLIAEEMEGVSEYREFNLDGQYLGRSLGAGHFPNEAEGIVLYTCDDGSGYWIATDQSYTENVFHVFDRVSFDYLRTFSAETVSNTDGTAISQSAFGPFAAGAFFAVHSDGGVGALDWKTIAEATGLRDDCVE
jgi:3-phytase